MFSFRPFLLLCVLFPIQLARADNNWYAVFWNATLKQQLNQTFLSYVQITPNDNSANQFQCDHTTIAFQPADNSSYIPRLGETHSAHILGYAHDEHGQAILLRYDGNYIPTLNSFPHTTISDENVGPYSAVYSNDLWARVNASGVVNITLRTGFPDTISFVDTTNVVNNSLTFDLPSITIGTKNYNATKVQVTLYPPGTIYALEGIFCVNIGWNGSVCTPPATSSPTSSSSSTSTSTGVSSTVASSTAISTGASTGASTASGSTGTSTGASTVSGSTGTSTGASTVSGSTGTSTGASTASGSSGSSSPSSSNTTTTSSSSSSVPYNTSSSSTAVGNTGMTVGLNIMSMVVVGIVGMIFA